MDLLKKHYEKIVLGVVLLVLMVGAAMLPIMIGRERDDLNKTAEEIINRPAKPLEPLDLSTNEIHLKQLKAGYSLDLSSSNKVFNPSQWQEAPDGRLIKLTTGREIGIEAVTVTKQTPLYLIISFDSVREAGNNYVISVERQASSNVSQRRKKVYYVAPGGKNDAFSLREVKGPAENPTELVLELTDSQDRVVVTKEKPFSREDGYMVDLKYEPEKRTWNDQRVDSTIKIGNETYKIVAIQKSEIVFSAKTNDKKTRIAISVAP